MSDLPTASTSQRKKLTFAGALLARNVPNTRDCVTVLALTKGGATTAVVEVLKGVNAFVVTTNQAGNRASRETFGTRSNVTRAVLTLLGGEAFVSMTVVSVVTLVVVVVVVVVAVFATLAIALVIVITVSGFTRRLRWVRRVGRSRGRVATKRVVGPVPPIAALRGRGITGRLLVRGTAAESMVPRPVVGTVLAGRRAGRILWSSIGETAVFTTPPKTWVGTFRLLRVRRTYLNCPPPQLPPPARTKGRARAKRRTREMSDILKSNQTKDGVGAEDWKPTRGKRRK